MKEYIVSLNVRFTTPLGVEAKSESSALSKAEIQFRKLFDKFVEKLDDMADLEIEEDYVEET